MGLIEVGSYAFSAQTVEVCVYREAGDDDPLLQLECPIRGGRLAEPEHYDSPEDRELVRSLSLGDHRRLFDALTIAFAASLVGDYLYYHRPLPEAAHRRALEWCAAQGRSDEEIARSLFWPVSRLRQFKRDRAGYSLLVLYDLISACEEPLGLLHFDADSYEAGALREPVGSVVAGIAKQYRYVSKDADLETARQALRTIGDMELIAQVATELMQYNQDAHINHA